MQKARSSRRVWEIDLIRLLTFAAVISVHSLAFTQRPSNEVAAGFMMLLQFGREVFFAITGFVLTYSSVGKSVRPWSFWRRRVPFVVVPYVVWTVIYFAFNISPTRHIGWRWQTLGHDLIYGGAEYHLYFLVVTVQIYLLFPLLLPFLRATANRVRLVLPLVVLANLAWVGVLYYGHVHGWVFARAYELAPTYTMYIVGGGYAALHWEKVHAYISAHARQLLTFAAVAAAVALGVYAWQLGLYKPRAANAVIQPAMFASCVAAVLVLAVVSERWVAAGMVWQRAIVIGSEISFGVYLAHPLILGALTRHGLGNGAQVVPSPLATIFGFTAAVVGASLLALAVRCTPLALPLIGRPQVRSEALSARNPLSGLLGVFQRARSDAPTLATGSDAAPVPALAKGPALSEVSGSGNQSFTSKG